MPTRPGRVAPKAQSQIPLLRSRAPEGMAPVDWLSWHPTAGCEDGADLLAMVVVVLVCWRATFKVSATPASGGRFHSGACRHLRRFSERCSPAAGRRGSRTGRRTRKGIPGENLVRRSLYCRQHLDRPPQSLGPMPPLDALAGLDDSADSQPRCVYATVPDGTPIRVLAWEGPHALVETPGPAGHLRRCRISRGRAEELLHQVGRTQLREFCHRSRRSERIGRERWREFTLGQARRGARARRSRRTAPRHRGSRRTSSSSRAGPDDDAGGEPPGPPRGTDHDLTGRRGQR